MKNKNQKSLIDQLPDNFINLSNEFRCALNRRDFLKLASLAGCSIAIPVYPRQAMPDNPFPADQQKFIIEARYYEKLDHRKIRCKLCPRECVIDDRERGYCGVRENRNGVYYTLVYARPCALHADPIEKKPLFHFYPGSRAFSIATAGCNVNCKFCQNWDISQVRPEEVRSTYLTPKRTAQAAQKSDCISIAYTYSEPTIFYEYMYDTAVAAREIDIKNVVVTAGYISREPLEKLCDVVDAIKVDLKSFSESYYKDIVNGELKPVLDSLITIKNKNIWLEIVYLMVPTLNDSAQEIQDLCKWIKENLGEEVPVHFTRFHPQYLLRDLPPTPVNTLQMAKDIGDSEGLKYIYIGNVPGNAAENTYCPNCKKPILRRTGYYIKDINIKKGRCAFCDTRIAGLWGI
jgi:pyruvate formate lyase activating enzyme